MKHQQISTNNFIKIYTDSTINLSQEFNGSNIKFIWRKKNQNDNNLEWIIIGNQHQYDCSPLDLNCKLEVQIQYQNSVVQTRNYGSIYLQQSLKKIKQNIFQAKVTLNKNINYSCHLNFPKQNNRQFQLQVQNCIFTIKKQYLTNNNYKNIQINKNNENNIISINIKNIKINFLEYLQTLRIPIHYGQYLKITFKNRLERDYFLDHLIERGFGFFEKNNIKQIKQQQITREQESTINYRQKIIKKQINEMIQQSNNSLQKSRFQDSMFSLDMKIVQDFYQILYTPNTQSKNMSQSKFCQNNQKIQMKSQIKKSNNHQLKIQRDHNYRPQKMSVSFGIGQGQNPQHLEIFSLIKNKQKQKFNKQIQFYMNNPQKILDLLLRIKNLEEQNDKLMKQNQLLQVQHTHIHSTRQSQYQHNPVIVELKQKMQEIVNRLTKLQLQTCKDKNKSRSTHNLLPKNKDNHQKVCFIPSFLKKDKNQSFESQQETRRKKMSAAIQGQKKLERPHLRYEIKNKSGQNTWKQDKNQKQDFTRSVHRIDGNSMRKNYYE